MSEDDRLTPEERKARKNAREALYRARPEVKARMKAKQAEYRARPEVKARQAAYRARADYKAANRARQAKYRGRPENKARIKAFKAEYEARPDRWARRTATLYGLSVEEFQALLAAGCVAGIIADGNRCKGRLEIDHDHSCCNRARSCGGCVRGALCSKHNTSLAGYEQSVSWAGKYLARYQAKQEGGRS